MTGTNGSRSRWARAVRRVREVRGEPGDDRGDVPGWVLITLMTAGIVTLLWATAGPMLNSLFVDAIEAVRGP
jgi:hypothetical protein